MSSAFERVDESLRVLAAHPAGLTVTEFSASLGLSKSTASRLLSGLIEAGIVERVPESQRHVIGLSMWAFGTAARRAHKVTDLAQIPMIQFVRQYNAPLNIAANRGLETIYLQRIEWQGDSIVAAPAGARMSAYVNASGKALLAFGPKADIEVTIHHGLKALTPNTITDPDKLREELKRARLAGYARNMAEMREGHCGIACPIFDGNGAPVAAVSAACTVDEWPGFEERLVSPLRTLATSISRSLGFEVTSQVPAYA